MQPILLSLFSVSLLIGSFYLGRRAQRRSSHRKLLLSKHYFVGLNYLLNEQPDKAVDVFIRMLDVDSDTLETHIAIGSLFRRRGEVDRAIRIHQNLIDKPNLSRSMRIQALMELGRDYMHAGLYDRAERLFLEAIDLGGKAAASSLKHLLTIYQHEKNWLKAIGYARLLESQMEEPAGYLIANYYCELIEINFMKLTDPQFKEYLQYTFLADPNCVRGSLIEAKWYERHGNFKAALKAYQRVREQDTDYLAETVVPITECYVRLGDEIGLRDYLYQCLNDSPQLPVILTIANKLQQWHGNKVAADFITEQLHTHPSIQGLNKLVEFYLQDAVGKQQTCLLQLQQLLQRFLRSKAAYQCQHCGFMAKHLVWLCPGCKHWNTVKPIRALAEEAT